MEAQVDYETELTLAAFCASEQAEEGLRRLEALGVSSTAITRVPLGPGRYQTEDITLEEANAGVRQGTVIGAPIGAAVGLGMATVVPETQAAVFVCMAAAGAIGGGIIGGFVGSIFRAHFDDDTAAVIEVPGENTAVLLAVRTQRSTPRAQSVFSTPRYTTRRRWLRYGSVQRPSRMRAGRYPRPDASRVAPRDTFNFEYDGTYGNNGLPQP